MAHGYLGMDPRTITATLGADLDAFEQALHAIVDVEPA
ncbi:MAG: hypothetical protein JW722_01120 [Demequinaceae bacterium]|nr:hypothetical protein [Demequinaceae bacterium]